MKEYFSHDYNARNDSKLVNLLMKKGLSGIGLYWCLSEMLYECNGYIMLNECERIAFELRINEKEIIDIINEFDLFKKDKKKFWSETILKRLSLRKEKSEKAKQSALTRWNNTNAMRTQNDSNAIKVNKSKEKEIKENIIDESIQKTIDFICKKFGVSEMLHFSNYKLIVNCVICQNNLGPEKFKHFKDQCWNYFIYKDLAKEKHHSFKSFIGTPEEQYLNGGWNSDNWIKKHTDIKAKEAGIESTIYPKEENKTKVYPKSKRQSEPDLLKTITERKL